MSLTKDHLHNRVDQRGIDHLVLRLDACTLRLDECSLTFFWVIVQRATMGLVQTDRFDDL
jgi:hypothetical protein